MQPLAVVSKTSRECGTGSSMVRSRRTLMAQAAPELGARTVNAIRPGMEAILLAAVALGCAQAGWDILTPRLAVASSPTPADTSEKPPEQAAAEIVSPFAPHGGHMEGASSVANALVNSLRVIGVRMSDDPSRSGAVLDTGGNQQTAYKVGDEIGPGVSLAVVLQTGIEVEVAGARRHIAFVQEQQVSYAHALMGLSPSDLAPADDIATDASTHVVVMGNDVDGSAAPDASEAAWLAATMSSVERDGNGNSVGWRVASPLPERARVAGLRDGDVIASINGAGPGAGAPALSAFNASAVTLDVRRADQSAHKVTLRMGVRA